MTAIDIGKIALQARIGLIRVGMIPVVIVILLALGAATWAWFVINARDQGQQEQALAQVRQGLREPSLTVVASPQSANGQNLHKFYDVLGDRSGTEQYLRTMFAIAGQTGLSLDHGEYQEQFDKNSGTYRYQILLPVKGSYRVIREFCERSLLALPFVSLDELGFKRESIDDDALDARLRFTLYLKDALRTIPEAGAAK
jgi:hypothetical protein